MDGIDRLAGHIGDLGQTGDGHGTGVLHRCGADGSGDMDVAGLQRIVAGNTIRAGVGHGDGAGDLESGAAVVDTVLRGISNGQIGSGEAVAAVNTVGGNGIDHHIAVDLHGTGVLDTILGSGGTHILDADRACGEVLVVADTAAGDVLHDHSAGNGQGAAVVVHAVFIAGGAGVLHSDRGCFQRSLVVDGVRAGIQHGQYAGLHRTGSDGQAALGSIGNGEGSAGGIDRAAGIMDAVAHHIADADACAAADIDGALVVNTVVLGIVGGIAFVGDIVDGHITLDGNGAFVQEAVALVIAGDQDIDILDGQAAGGEGGAGLDMDSVDGLSGDILHRSAASNGQCLAGEDRLLAGGIHQQVAIDGNGAVIDTDTLAGNVGNGQITGGHLALVIDGMALGTVDDQRTCQFNHAGTATVLDTVAAHIGHVDGLGGKALDSTAVVEGMAADIEDDQLGALGDDHRVLVATVALIALGTHRVVCQIADDDLAGQGHAAIVAGIDTGLVIGHSQVGHKEGALVVHSRAVGGIADGQIIAGEGSGRRVHHDGIVAVDAGDRLVQLHAGAGHIRVIVANGQMIHHGDASLDLQADALRAGNLRILGHIVDHQAVAAELGAAADEDAVVARAVDDHIGGRHSAFGAQMQGSTPGIDDGGIGQIQHTGIDIHQVLGGGIGLVADLGAVYHGAVKLCVAGVVDSLLGRAGELQTTDDHVAGIAQQQVAGIGDGHIGSFHHLAVEDAVLAGIGDHRGAGDGQLLGILDAVLGGTVDVYLFHGHGAGIVDAVLAGGGNVRVGDMHRAAVVIYTVDRRTGDDQLAGGGEGGIIVDAVVAGVLDSHILQVHDRLVLDAVTAGGRAVQSGIGQGHHTVIVVADAVLARVGDGQACDGSGAAVGVDTVLAGAGDQHIGCSESAGIIDALAAGGGNA